MNLSTERIFSAILKRSVRRPVPDLVFMALALITVSWGLGRIVRGFPTGPTVWAGLVGVPFAWWAATRPKRRVFPAFLVFAAGIFLLIVQAGDLLGTLWWSFLEMVRIGWMLAQDFLVQTFSKTPPSPITLEVPPDWLNLINGLALVWGRFSNWLGLFLEKRPFYDQAAVAIWWSGIAWVMAWWAGIILRWRRSALLAAAPGGILLAAILNRSSGDPRYLLPFAGSILALLASSSYFQAREGWEKKGLDLPDTLGIDTSVWAAALLAVVLVLGFMTTTLPALSLQTLREMTASLHPAGSTGKTGADALGVQPANRVPTPQTRVGSASLPRQHLIGASPELSEEPALYLKVLSDSNATPEDLGSERYYLRGLAYDVYQHAGWASSSVSTRQFEPGETIQTPDPEEIDRRQVEQEVTLAPNHRGMILVVGDALAINRSVEATWRAAPSGTADIFGLGVAENEYRAWSSQPQASAEELRRASQDYPNWIRQRYLQLPDGIPSRVVALAATFTYAPTAYDTAAAIEAYLRTYPYTLDIPQPPVRQDIVDYFLFDLKEGYCDYYASAMVILARLNGLPARLVIGYVASEYDPANQIYVVREKSAHSWVEIYFPAYGWIPFEPTASFNPFLRNAASPLSPNLQNPIPYPPDWLRSSQTSWMDWGLLAIGLALLSLLIGVQLAPVVDRWWVNKNGIPVAITRLYRRFERLAMRMAGPQPAGNTPSEMDRSLSTHLAGLQWPLRRASTHLRAAASELTNLYIAAAYTPRPSTRTDLQRAWQLWGHLRRNSNLILLLKPRKAPKKRIQE